MDCGRGMKYKKISQCGPTRKQKLHIYRLRNEEGEWITESEDIKTNAIHSFKSQLNGSHVSSEDTLLDDIPQIIFSEQSEALSKFPSMEKIYEVISNRISIVLKAQMGSTGPSIPFVGKLLNMISMKQSQSSL